MPRVPLQKGEQSKASSKKYKNVQTHLGEETDSSFHSVSTDIDATDYNLEYTSGSAKTRPQPSRSPRRSERESVRRSTALSSPSRNNPVRNVTIPQGRVSRTREESTTSRAPNTSSVNRGEDKGSARRKTRSPKKSRPGAVGPNIRARTNALKEIRKFQSSTKNLIPKLPFSRVIRELLRYYTTEDMRVTPVALEALQEAAELYMVQLLSDAYKCTLHRDRVTLMVKDIQLVRYLRGRTDPGNL